METKDKKFDEQDHPLKNTDKAFVQVGKNGEPVIPNKEADSRDKSASEETTGLNEHR